MRHTKTTASKYIQQHLANERTYLAWIRTSITIIGLGFLSAGLVFETTSRFFKWAHILASIVGIGCVLLGGLIIAFATFGYFTKQRTINSETFVSPVTKIWMVFISFFFINLCLIILVVFLLLKKI